jgi:hypothetical protein
MSEDLRFGVLDVGKGANHDGLMAELVVKKGWKVGGGGGGVAGCEVGAKRLTEAEPGQGDKYIPKSLLEIEVCLAYCAALLSSYSLCAAAETWSGSCPNA